MKQVWEKIVEGILTCSGFITSITIVLIVIFLFTEAFGLFGNKVTEEGYVLAVNGKNPVRELSAVQIKDVFDEEITNWSEVGGPDIGIKVFRLEDITSYFSEEELGAEYDKAGECIGKVVADHPGIIAFVEWYTVGGIRILRADSYCTSHSKGVRFAGGRDRFGWKHCVGYYGFAYYYHGQRGCYA